MSGTIESEELDIMLKGLFAMAGIEFDQQVQGVPKKGTFKLIFEFLSLGGVLLELRMLRTLGTKKYKVA